MLNKKELELLKQTGVNDKEVTEKLVNFLRHEFDNVVRVKKEDYRKEVLKLVDNKTGSYTFIDDESGEFLVKMSIFNYEKDGESFGLNCIALSKEGWLVTLTGGEFRNTLFSSFLRTNEETYGIDLVDQLVNILDGETIATQKWVNEHSSQKCLLKFNEDDTLGEALDSLGGDGAFVVVDVRNNYDTFLCLYDSDDDILTAYRFRNDGFIVFFELVDASEYRSKTLYYIFESEAILKPLLTDYGNFTPEERSPHDIVNKQYVDENTITKYVIDSDTDMDTLVENMKFPCAIFDEDNYISYIALSSPVQETLIVISNDNNGTNIVNYGQIIWGEGDTWGDTIYNSLKIANLYKHEVETSNNDTIVVINNSPRSIRTSSDLFDALKTRINAYVIDSNNGYETIVAFDPSYVYYWQYTGVLTEASVEYGNPVVITRDTITYL